MKVPRFDIFSGTDNNAQWIEVVEGLDTAFRRMEFYAAKCPGQYFVFDCSEHTIADAIDTSPLGNATIENVARGWGISAVADSRSYPGRLGRTGFNLPGKSSGFNGSTQHWLEV